MDTAKGISNSPAGTYPLDLFAGVTSCLHHAIELTRAFRADVPARIALDLPLNLTAETLTIGSWIGWASQRSYEFTESKEAFERCRQIISLVETWCCSEIVEEMRLHYDHKKPSKPRKKKKVSA